MNVQCLFSYTVWHYFIKIKNRPFAGLLFWFLFLLFFLLVLLVSCCCVVFLLFLGSCLGAPFSWFLLGPFFWAIVLVSLLLFSLVVLLVFLVVLSCCSWAPVLGPLSPGFLGLFLAIVLVSLLVVLSSKRAFKVQTQSV